MKHFQVETCLKLVTINYRSSSLDTNVTNGSCTLLLLAISFSPKLRVVVGRNWRERLGWS